MLLSGFIRLTRITPHLLAMWNGWMIAGIIHHVFGFRKREARSRIREVFPDLPEKDVRRIAWRSFRNLAFNAIEIIRAPSLSSAWESKYMDCEKTMDDIQAYTDTGRGVIVALVHAGNWDLAGVIASRRSIPAAFIARSQKNPLTNKFVNEMRSLRGSVIVDRDDPRFLPKVLEQLNAGKALAILIDLRSKTNVPDAEYLGKPANLSAGIVMIAQHARVPILPMALVRDGWFGHRWLPMKPIETQAGKNKKQERAEVLQALLDQFSGFVMDNPEQYFWYNKRWVLEPFEDMGTETD